MESVGQPPKILMPDAVASGECSGSASLEPLRVDCFRALHCLHIAVEPTVAEDVNAKVKAYILALENLITG